MHVEKKSPCKVNLLLNILGRRPDGFHELETVMQPVNLFDGLTFKRSGGITLSCSDKNLAVDSSNLVYRAAEKFLAEAKISEGVQIHLDKKIPMAAGLGGGSGNAATTLLGLNELFGTPLSLETLDKIGATLGSDVPFFLYNKPALATGRGEKVESVEAFPALKGHAFILVRPEFGISTPWAYQNLARFPEALNGRKGRAKELVSLLQGCDWASARAGFHNSLEAPAFDKFPVFALYKEFFLGNGALASLMSGSSSTTFAIADTVSAAETLVEQFKAKFGSNCWSAVVPIPA